MSVLLHITPFPRPHYDSGNQILNKIGGDNWHEVMGGGTLGIPESLLEKRYSTDTEKTHAFADYYVNCHPEASWEHLTGGLYSRREFAAARESKSFMSTGKYCTSHNYCHAH